jgi:O-antigen ligase
MTQATVIDFVRHEEPRTRVRLADLLSKAIFGMLLFLIVVAPIPYGTTEPWWKAVFVCFIFGVSVLAIIERLLSNATRIAGAGVLLPMFALSVLAALQTISLRGDGNWNAISADPYQTRFVVLQLLALTALLALLYRYVNTQARVRTLIYVVLAIAVASAVYGILRQTMQRSPGFILPLVRPGQGYGQFINKNHFAYLMEMALGLGLGLIVAGGLKRERVLLFVGLLMPVWTGLVLSNSRGGILAMLAQVVVATLLLLTWIPSRQPSEPPFLEFARSFAARSALVIVLLFGVIVGVFWVGGDRLIGSFDSVSRELDPTAGGLNEGATRNEIWRATAKMIGAHPILGVGLGGYWVAITRYHEASGTLTPQEAHNDYLELLSSGGIIGFCIGIWFVVMVAQRIRKQLASDNRFRRALCFAALLGITGIAVHSLVDFGLHMLANAAVFIVLIMMATADISNGKQVIRH